MNKKIAHFILKTFEKFGYELHRVQPTNDPFIPPYYLRTIIGPFYTAEYYKSVGEEYLKYFKELCDLKPGEDVLDIGCGCGHLAVPLIKYLNTSAKYEGFDIDPVLIKWCVKNISPKYPNFHFQHANIYNKCYNPRGHFKASEYRFPYNDGAFDLVFLVSVFTHMQTDDVENYMHEIARVLNKGGRCFITFHLLNKQSLDLIESGSSTLDFKYTIDNFKTIDKASPEAAIAYAEDYILDLFHKCGLEIVNPIRYGSWCGRSEFLCVQDMIIARKA
jgi:SAM-dependent methyltransferase